MKIRVFITHKLAENFSDCQDRFSINPDTKSVALADGMSQSYQQKIWASLLTDSYTSNPEFVPNKASVEELSTQWHEQVKKYIEDLTVNHAPQYLIIMNQNALAMKKSAGATFLGIRFAGNQWNGDVLGDSCLIEIENNKILRILTSQQGDEFDNHPDYFDSDSSKDGKGTPLQISGKITEQTSIILVSDPFSDFLNEKKKEGKEEIFLNELLQVSNHDEFEALVDKWRKEYGMHNDDSTLIIIEHDGTNDFHCDNIDNIEELITKEKKQQATLEAQQETTSCEPQENLQIDEPIIDNSLAIPISENDFIKMLLDEYHCLARSTPKRSKTKNKSAKKDVNNLIREIAQAVYKKLNITKK